MKKWLLIGLSLLVLLGVGATFAFDYVADKTMKKVTDEVMKDPEVKKMLEDKNLEAKLKKATNDQAIQAEIQKAAASSTASGKKNGESGQQIHFANNSEAAKYAMKRFSVSEINEYRSMASDGLTSEEKKKIKQDILSRFSPEEIQAFIDTAKNSK
jgi:maltodextrin utilization protein YvdJ